jgi:hydrogenase expression/formation protein HypE
MTELETSIKLDHGEGGAASQRLISQVFIGAFGGQQVLEDATVVPGAGRLAVTTDSFVVRPIEFPGGDLGKLAICGTVNDLAMMGAIPKYITASFILEEGLSVALLKRIVNSMATTAREAGVAIVAGDTKVVGRGEADGIFINTSGIGFVPEKHELSAGNCRTGDVILVSGSIAEHGIAVMVARENFGIKGDLVSDCTPLASLAQALLQAVPEIRCMRDLTRGGLASVLVELSQSSNVGIDVVETEIPVRHPVRAACGLLGLDPLYVACEGRLIAVVPEQFADLALRVMRSHTDGSGGSIIGSVTDWSQAVYLETVSGGHRPLILLEGSQLPRIC